LIPRCPPAGRFAARQPARPGRSRRTANAGSRACREFSTCSNVASDSTCNTRRAYVSPTIRRTTKAAPIARRAADLSIAALVVERVFPGVFGYLEQHARRTLRFPPSHLPAKTLGERFASESELLRHGART